VSSDATSLGILIVKELLRNLLCRPSELYCSWITACFPATVCSFSALAAYNYAASTIFRVWDTLSSVKDTLYLFGNQSIQSTPIKSLAVSMHQRLCGPMVELEAPSDRLKPENSTGRQNLMSNPTPKLGAYFISESSTPGNTGRVHADPTSSWSQKQIWAKYTGILIPILSLLFTGARLFLFGNYPPQLR
jgi:hypothetical protein